LIQAIRQHDVLVVIGDTGSGKTTQIPQYVLEDDPGAMVVVTQPRRIAAITVARRVAKEQDVRLGSHVGYAVRFDDCSTDKTSLRYVTDGLLLREAVQDPLLVKYTLVVVDEAHERTLDTDMLFGLLKRVQQQRTQHGHPQLKMLIMSATLNVSMFVRTDRVRWPSLAISLENVPSFISQAARIQSTFYITRRRISHHSNPPTLHAL
jgi:HrpA-like RNA helicase